jgi:small subunit ribosomal protein S20
VAHSLSAKKRVRQNVKRRLTNRARRSQIKTQIKRIDKAIESQDLKAAGEQYRQVAQKLDKVAARGTIHKKTAARKKSRLAKKLNSLKTKGKAPAGRD